MAAPASYGPRWWRRWPRDDHDEPRVMEEEEGEVVPGGCHSNSETDTEDYYNRHSPSEYDDDEADSGRRGTVPANNGGHGASTSSVAPRGWGGTGKRGRSGASAVSSRAEPDHRSMAAAAPKAVVKPVPLAFAPPSDLPASSSVPTASGARTTNLSGESSIAQSVHDDDAMETVVALAGAASASPPAEAAAVHHQPVAPPPRPAAAGRQNPNGYTCPKCGMWFATHQGLGGHSVGHKHREREEQLLAAAEGGGGCDDDGKRRRERVHVCGECGAEYATGVQLGGHMRKHWTGAPIVPKKKKPRAAAVLEQLLPPPAGAVRATNVVTPPTVEPAARSPLMGRLRLFGVDIGPAVKTPATRQGSPATGSSRSTGGQQNSHSQ